MKALGIVLAFAACSRPLLRPVPDDPRRARAARVEMQCGDWIEDPDAPWAHTSHGAAVLIDDRHALTAAHLFDCPDIYVAHLELASGRTLIVVPESSRGGVTTIEPLGLLDRFPVGRTVFEHDFAVGDTACACPPGACRCGAVLQRTSREIELESPGYHGESGAGVWIGSDLVGIVQGISDRGDAVASVLP